MEDKNQNESQNEITIFNGQVNSVVTKKIWELIDRAKELGDELALGNTDEQHKEKIYEGIGCQRAHYFRLLNQWQERVKILEEITASRDNKYSAKDIVEYCRVAQKLNPLIAWGDDPAPSLPPTQKAPPPMPAVETPMMTGGPDISHDYTSPKAVVKYNGQYYSSDDVKNLIKENEKLKKDKGRLIGAFKTLFLFTRRCVSSLDDINNVMDSKILKELIDKHDSFEIKYTETIKEAVWNTPPVEKAKL